MEDTYGSWRFHDRSPAEEEEGEIVEVSIVEEANNQVESFYGSLQKARLLVAEHPESPTASYGAAPASSIAASRDESVTPYEFAEARTVEPNNQVESFYGSLHKARQDASLLCDGENLEVGLVDQSASGFFSFPSDEFSHVESNEVFGHDESVLSPAPSHEVPPLGDNATISAVSSYEVPSDNSVDQQEAVVLSAPTFPDLNASEPQESASEGPAWEGNEPTNFYGKITRVVDETAGSFVNTASENPNLESSQLRPRPATLLVAAVASPVDPIAPQVAPSAFIRASPNKDERRRSTTLGDQLRAARREKESSLLQKGLEIVRTTADLRQLIILSQKDLVFQRVVKSGWVNVSHKSKIFSKSLNWKKQFAVIEAIPQKGFDISYDCQLLLFPAEVPVLPVPPATKTTTRISLNSLAGVHESPSDVRLGTTAHFILEIPGRKVPVSLCLSSQVEQLEWMVWFRRVSSRSVDALREKLEQLDFELVSRLQSEMPWFVPTMTREDAEAILTTCYRDSFIVRASSKARCYVASLFESKNAVVSHVLIKRLADFSYCFDEEAKSNKYPTLLDLIQQNPRMGTYTVPRQLLESKSPDVIAAKVDQIQHQKQTAHQAEEWRRTEMEREQEKEKLTCKVCFDADVEARCEPCGCVWLCDDCASRGKYPSCILCQRPVSKVTLSTGTTGSLNAMTELDSKSLATLATAFEALESTNAPNLSVSSANPAAMPGHDALMNRTLRNPIAPATYHELPSPEALTQIRLIPKKPPPPAASPPLGSSPRNFSPYEEIQPPHLLSRVASRPKISTAVGPAVGSGSPTGAVYHEIPVVSNVRPKPAMGEPLGAKAIPLPAQNEREHSEYGPVALTMRAITPETASTAEGYGRITLPDSTRT